MSKLFPLHIEVEEVALGRVMRTLHNMPGVAKVHLDLGAPKPSASAKLNGHGGARKPRGQFALTTRVQLLQWLNAKPLRAKDINALMTQAGRGKSYSSALHKMKTDGEVRRTPDGVYSITAKGAKAIKAEAEAAEAKATAE